MLESVGVFLLKQDIKMALIQCDFHSDALKWLPIA